MGDFMNEKIKCLREQLRGLDIQGMIVSNPVNIRYLTGISAEGVLLITRKENYYITDARYIEEVQSTITIDDEIIVYNYTDISEYDYENFFHSVKMLDLKKIMLLMQHIKITCTNIKQII